MAATRKAPRISPSPMPGRPGWRVTFRNPVLRRVRTVGLDTRDEMDARGVCRDIEGLLSDPSLWQEPNSPRLRAYDPRAVRAVFGVEVETAEEDRAGRLSADDVGRLTARVFAVLEETRRSGADPHAAVEAFLDEYISRDRAELEDRNRGLETEVKGLRPEVEELRATVARLLRTRNAHVKTRIGEALREWRREYEQDRQRMTVVNAEHAVRSFIASLEGRDRARLGEIRGRHVDAWLQQLKGDAGQDLAPVTRSRRKAYLSSFLGWARRRYELVENPVEQAAPVAGAARAPEQIIALRRLEDFTTLLDGLRPWPYWRAWLAVAVLAGPRWAEQAWLRIEDVYLDEGYLRIATRAWAEGRRRGTKTGRERNVPLERTTLKQILAEHLARRRAEQRARGATPGQASPFFFPTILADNPSLPRRLSPPGLWSSDRNWTNAWQRVALVACGRAKDDAAAVALQASAKGRSLELSWPWSLKGREWRHSFGTALGMCGWNSLEISRVMGNSEHVCQRHYVAVACAGRRWPF